MEKKILGGIWGLCVGDAVGVPFEFCSREALSRHPAVDMRGYGTYAQPKGTWSDDTSMTLCLLDSLSHGLDYSDIMQKFLSWLKEAKYTPHNKVFDVGQTSRESIMRYAGGVPPLRCGSASEYDNGNGSLMRILPLAFYLNRRFGKNFFEQEEAIAIIHNVSALTHAHKRSQIACGIYISVAERLFSGSPLQLRDAFDLGTERAWKYYSQNAAYAEELRHYERIHAPGFSALPREQIKSSGYVVDTLEAALWCLLNTSSYADCILTAVNLGADTDTTAAIAGGLAGLYYGYDAIPPRWREKIARGPYITGLCRAFYAALERVRLEKIYSYIPYFEAAEPERVCQWRAGETREDGVFVLGFPVYEDTLHQFIDDVYSSSLIDYAYTQTLQKYTAEWRGSLVEQIDAADWDFTRAILTRYIRAERFCDGQWADAVKEGVFLALLKRLKALTPEA